MRNSSIGTRRRAGTDHGGTRAPRRGLTLTEFVVVLLVCMLSIAAIRSMGARTVIVILAFTIVWARAYLCAPELTCHASVLAIIGLLALSIAPIRLLEMRETARRQTARNSLRQIGQVIHALNDAGTPGTVEDRLNEHRDVQDQER